MLSGQGISTPSLLNMAQVKPTYQIETKIRHNVNPNLEIPRKRNILISLQTYPVNNKWQEKNL
jgi:hypothetical protein